MNMIIRTAFLIILVSQAPNSRAQDDGASEILVAAGHAQVIKLAYDAAHLANAIQYHQARTILSGVGGYTRYDYSDRITENNWLYSQIEAIELQLPRMKKTSERIALSEGDAAQIGTLFAGLEDLMLATRKVHSAIKEGDLETANRLYYEEVDEPYNAAIAAAHTLIDSNDRAITMMRLRAK